MKKSITQCVYVILCVFFTNVALAGFYMADDGISDYKGPMGTQAAAKQATPSVTKQTNTAKVSTTNTSATKANRTTTAPRRTTQRRSATKKPAAPKTITYTVYSGSLKRNVERIIQRSHWGQLVWTLPYDYRWVGTARLTGQTVQEVLEKLLANYPLQAVFYEQNHVVSVKPRPTIAYRRPDDLAHANADARIEADEKVSAVADPDQKAGNVAAVKQNPTTNVAKQTSSTQKGGTHA